MAGRAPQPLVRAPGRTPARERLAVVASRFHEEIVKKLVHGALEALAGQGLPAARVDVHWVPGCFELPQAALLLARSGAYDAVACAGVVIKGATPHFDYICEVAAHGITRAALDTGVPVSFGVITALTEEQAWERAGGRVGNRGEEAALAALEMARFRRAALPRRGRKAR